eukprot:GHVN01020275.1.p3 GENE.GHVN01020275.1~~GHVN01020275.1.p3  ORF type:complete len:222 (-),score=24.08 GHVN01020275.1:1247-1912(-)
MGQPTPDDFLSRFDFSGIDEMDPSIKDNHRIVYDRECPLELRMQHLQKGPQEIGSLEPVRAKILLLGDEGSPEHLRVELSCENDLFFRYDHSVDDNSFRQLQEGQKLMVDFSQYAAILIKMFNSCIKEPHSFLAVFIMQNNGAARLDFIQNIEYKFVELLCCDFVQAREDAIRQHISFRYNAVKSKLALCQARLQDINTILKIKNPSLLVQIQKSTSQRGV